MYTVLGFQIVFYIDKNIWSGMKKKVKKEKKNRWKILFIVTVITISLMKMKIDRNKHLFASFS